MFGMWPRSLERILGGFTKVERELKAFVQRSATENAERNARIKKLQEEAATVMGEMTRAEEVALNMRKLFYPGVNN